MEQTIILQGLTADQFFTKLDEIIKNRVEITLKEALKEGSKKKTQYISRKEVCEIVKISLPTLHQWTKDGLLISYKIGNRVLFKSDEVDESLTKRKFYRGNPNAKMW